MDGYTGNLAFLTDPLCLRQTLLELVNLVGMKPISEPLVVNYPDGNGRERGLSGMVFLAESNITAHTYPEYGFVFLDIFSCRSFMPEHILNWLKDKLGLHNFRTAILSRGIIKGRIIPVGLS